MGVSFTLIGGDSKPEPSIDDIFAILSSNLYLIKSCRIKSIKELRININPNALKANVFRFQEEGLRYINAALQSIIDIRDLGDKVVSHVERNHIDELDNITDEQNKSHALSFINDVIDNTESELISLKNELIERGAMLDASGKDKMRLELSVEEIGTLFRGFEKAGIIIAKDNPSISQFIAQNFSAKKGDTISPKSVSNQMSSHTEKTINSILAVLHKVSDEVNKLKPK